MSIYNEHASGLRELQDELGEDCPKIWIGGRLISALAGSASLQKTISPGGFSIECDLSITCLTEDFEDVQPVQNQTFNYPGQAGRSYRIVSITSAPGGKQLQIDAVSTSQKA
jgi:hypothetical protein